VYDLHKTQDFWYIVPNGTAALTCCPHQDDEVINVPAVIEGYKVTELYEGVLEYSSVVEINIPEGVEVIGKQAFRSCRSLRKVNLPSTLKYIHEYAFESCDSLENINLPDHAVLISQAFYKCTNLKSINVSDNNDNYYSKDGVLYTKGDNMLALYPLGKTEEILEIDKNTKSIFAYVFAFNTNLKKIIIPETFTEISAGAFSMAAALEEVIMTDNVQKIGKQAFANCISLAHIKLPSNLKVIDEGAFMLSGLVDVDIPEGTEAIESKAFFNCEKLKSVKLKTSLQKIAEEAFAKCTALDDIELLWGRMSFVNPMAFAACLSLKEIRFPECMIVTPGLFVSCQSVETVYLNDKVIHIGQQSFEGCSALKKIYIFDSTTEIDSKAFYKCDALTDIIYSGDEEQWNNIKISSDGNDALKTAKVHFNA